MSTQETWWTPEALARRRPALAVRSAAAKSVRAYFQAEGFAEVDTPALQVSPGIERHIRGFATHLTEPFADKPSARFLHTSPEFAMKKLLAAGMQKIFQLSHVFRDGERSPLHHPEFTMLEWYRVGTDYTAMMDDCAALARKVAMAAHRTLETEPLLRWQGRVCDPAKPVERLTVQEAFARYAEIDLLATIDDPNAPLPEAQKLKAAAKAQGIAVSDSDTWEDVFFKVMLERIEHRLGEGALTILCDYPACLAALSRRKPGDTRLAERFEMYACGVELANAFSELTDVKEQRARFAHDIALHEKLYGHAPPLDENFLKALESLPDSSGCALGFDRLVMLAAGAGDITDVLWASVE